MKEIVKLLTENGYEAYIVGGYVRDYLLGIESNDVDICTSAPISKISSIFKNRGVCFKEYYSYHIKEDNMSYDITTFRIEKKYKNNKPVSMSVAKSLKDDLLRRDFTINTFAIDKDGKLIDLLDAKKDLDSKIIRVVGDTIKKFTEDKTRILRAIRFSCTLDFDLDPSIIEFLESKKISYLNDITKEFKKSELDKIFDCLNVNKFFYLLNRYNIKKYFNIEYENDIIYDVYNKYGIWAQLETDLPISNRERRKISKIKKLVSNNNITLEDVKNYDYEVIYNAASILKMSDKVNSLYEIIKLHSLIDIELSIDEMLEYVSVSDIKRVYKLVERGIMEGLVANRKDDIIEYIRKL